ncbi:uncharacterized protein LOC112517452 [Cynara cardunculus var. scolymus]|uniref:uncharacterized protein LOC112517452 n=1 Tax=Cynara cardunculus var. scolymus TaxID=59895 RepID=UPI000D6235E3|nr:uncharacterized protein LOC112517452 [Cynara cardunculus var. scolymus]
MKFHVMFIVFLLLSLHNFEAQGMRLGKVSLSISNHQELIKISSIGGSNQDHELLAKTVELSSGINRKLMTKIASSGTTTTISKNHKNDGNKNDPKPRIKSTRGSVSDEENFFFNLSSENSKNGKDVANEPYPNDTDITGMDYTPARKKSPIHN